MSDTWALSLSDDELLDALRFASPPALLASLVHLAGSTSVLRPSLRPNALQLREPMAGFSAGQLDELTALAAEVMASYRGGRALPPAPSSEDVATIMSFIAGADVPEPYVPMMLGEMKLDGQDEYAINWRVRPSTSALDRFHVLVVGAGMSGLCAAIRLKEAGFPFTVVEKNPAIGGTWFENTYPGCRVDVPNHFYSYSFEPNHDWPEHFSQRKELQGYFEACAHKYEVFDRISFSTSVTSALWDPEACVWRVELVDADGGARTIEANALISGVGQLNRPKIPSIDGLSSFTGPAFHSAQWEHSHDFTGKRVAVIGTGASAMQFAPELQKIVSHLVVFQRSANWASYNAEYAQPVDEHKKWLLKNVPFYAKWYRFLLFWRTSDGSYPSIQIDPDWPHPDRSLNALNDAMRQFVTSHIESELAGRPDLIAKAVPTYPPMGKRALIDNGWFKMLRQPNVSLVCDGVARVSGSSVVTAAGESFDVDAIVFATGFDTHRFLFPMHIVGDDGVALAERWGEDPRAYLGLTMPHYPNLFCLYGPNTNLGHGGSIIFHTECQVRYVIRCLRELIEGGHRAMACRQDVHDDYNHRLDAQHARMVWAHPGMESWYKNSKGRVTTNSPWRLVDYWQMTREPDRGDFDFA